MEQGFAQIGVEVLPGPRQVGKAVGEIIPAGVVEQSRFPLPSSITLTVSLVSGPGQGLLKLFLGITSEAILELTLARKPRQLNFEMFQQEQEHEWTG